jgi:hypothetical protein
MADGSYISYNNALEYFLSIVDKKLNYLVFGGNKYSTLGTAQVSVFINGIRNNVCLNLVRH